jgi:hypothetical protein
MTIQLIINRPTTDITTYNTSLIVVCYTLPYLAGQVNYPSSNSFTITVFFVVRITITLSSDNSYISVTNSQGTTCGSVAYREASSITTIPTTTETITTTETPTTTTPTTVTPTTTTSTTARTTITT